MADEELKLKVGRTYRGKRPQNRNGLVNDRTILYIGATHIQYDGPVVGFGRHYPSCTREAFLKWAERGVTDELPKGEYAEWPIKN